MNEDAYINFVMESAKSKGKLFMLDSGEGNDQIDSITGWYIEDLSGWLIDSDKRDIFISARRDGTVNEYFSNDYVFVKWLRTSDCRIDVNFIKY